MEMHIVLSVILSSAIVFVITAERNPLDFTSSLTGDYKKWDRLLLALQWPPTFCIDIGQACLESRVQNNWTIHGLWPNQGSSAKPVYCNKSSHFDLKQIQDLREGLDERWISYNKSMTNEEFWSREWIKHGTCAVQLASISSQHGYFSRTLQLSFDVDLYGLLSRANIRPSEKLFYPSESVRSALQRGLGDAFGMYCIYGNGDNEASYLFEVRICYDKSFNLTKCGKIYGKQCDRKLKIKIPPKL